MDMVSHAENDENRLKEMSEGLPINQANKGTNLSSDDDDDPTIKSINPPVKNVKKTLKTKRKKKEQRKLALQRAMEKVEKKKVADIYKLRILDKQLVGKEKKEEVLRKKREKVKERKALEPNVLSRIKFEPINPDFKLSEELCGNLRNLEPTGNILKDRYKSLQQRNILAPATLVLKRSKAKVKKFEKPDHKINWSEATKDL